MVTSFDQCVLQVEARKPTTQLHGHVPILADAITARGCRGRCNHGPHAHRVLRGRDRADHWNTAPAKVYPPEMCKVIGQAIIHTMVRAWPWTTASDFQDLGSFAALYQPLDPYLTTDSWARDTFDSHWVG